ncbi:hypothetical protein NW759_015451 [Fusarium solani]|nr:hypothetical protein NW759_015451 [Fusarium solani]
MTVSEGVAGTASESGEALNSRSLGGIDSGKEREVVKVSRGRDAAGLVVGLSSESEEAATAIKFESLENAILEMAPPSGATNVLTRIQLSLCQIIIVPPSDPDASSFSSAETAKALTGLRCPSSFETSRPTLSDLVSIGSWK